MARGMRMLRSLGGRRRGTRLLLTLTRILKYVACGQLPYLGLYLGCLVLSLPVLADDARLYRYRKTSTRRPARILMSSPGPCATRGIPPRLSPRREGWP